MFPAFSTSFVQDPNRAKRLFNRGVKYIFLLLFPITLVIITFANEGLNLWLGKEFAENSTVVLQWLAVGVLINSLAQVPFALLQGLGKPDITAKLHFIELPLYILMLWQMTNNFGIAGAAYTWVARVALDTIFLFYIANKFLRNNVLIVNLISLMLGSIILMLPFAIFQLEFLIKGILFLLISFIFTLITWFKLLDYDERKLIKKKIKLV